MEIGWGGGCGALEELEGDNSGSLHFTYVVYMYRITKNNEK